MVVSEVLEANQARAREEVMADKLREALDDVEKSHCSCDMMRGYVCGIHARVKAVERAALAKSIAGQADCTLVPNSALRWLFGEEGDFVDPIPGSVRPYWWRPEFRKRIAQPVPAKEKELPMRDEPLNPSKQSPGAASGEQTREVPLDRAKELRSSYIAEKKKAAREIAETVYEAILAHRVLSIAAPLAKAGETSGEWDEQAIRKLACEIWNNYAKDPEWCVKRIIGILERAGRAASGGQRVTLRMLNLALARARWGGPFDPQYAVDHLNEELRLAAPAAAPELSKLEQQWRLTPMNMPLLDSPDECSGYLKGRLACADEVNALLRSKAGQPAGAPQSQVP